MRHFTKTHNDLKWLFPIAKTKKEAEKVFESAENQAKYLADMAGVKEEDKDLAIDCFMKGYSQALQMEVHQAIEKAVENIYCNIFKVKFEVGNDKKCKSYFRFHKLYDLFRSLTFRPNKDVEKARKYFVKLIEKTGFDRQSDIVEQMKIW